MQNNTPIKTKKKPERRCAGCSEHRLKSELIRVVRSPEGEVSLDKTGKASGRGVYICRDAACLKKARKAKRIEHILECEIPDSLFDKMEQEIEGGDEK